MKSLGHAIERFFEMLALVLFKHRIKTLILVLMGFIALASNLGRLTADVTTEGFLHKSDPSLKAYNHFKHQFGNDDLIIIGIRSDAIFSLPFLEKLRDLHTELEDNVPYVDDITSLVNARNTFGENDELLVQDLCDPFPETESGVAQLRQRVLANPLYEDLIISEDGAMTTIVIKLVATPALDDVSVMAGFGEEGGAAGATRETLEGDAWLSVVQNSEAVLKATNIVEKYESPGFTISLSGTSCVNHFLKETLSADTKRFMKLAYLGVMVFLVIMFRRFAGVIAPIIVVTLSLVSVLSLMALTGVSFKLPTQILPSFILAVGVGYSVHILALFYHRLDTGAEPEAAMAHAMGHSGLAVVMTALTTAAGLFSFASSEVAPIAELGLFAGAGVFFAMAYTFVLLPPILSFAGRPRPGRKNKGRGLDPLLIAVARLSTGHPLTVLTVSALLFLFACMGIPRLNFSHDVLRWLPDTEVIRTDTERIDTTLGGSVNMEVIIDTGMENGLYDPDFMARLEAAAAEINVIVTPAVSTGKVWSLADILKETNKALHNNDDRAYVLPESRALTAQELFMFENSGSDDLEDFTDSLFSRARLSVKLPFIDAISYSNYIDRVNEKLEAQFPDVSVTTTGMIMIYSRVIAAGIKSMQASYLYALGTITILMILLLGNVRIGLVSMVPNLLPIVLILGVAGWCSVPVSLFIMLVGNIAMGLAVDDTIHFMHNFRRYYEASGDVGDAVTKTLLSAGRPMVITTVVLGMGFFIYLFSGMNHLTDFGLLTGSAIVLALMADFFVAPALVTLLFQGRAFKPLARPAGVKPTLFLGAMVLAGMASPGAHAADQPEARAIMEKVDTRYDGDDMQTEMTMILMDKNQKKRVRHLKTFSMDNGPDTWSIMFFLSPVDVRDTGFLSYDIDATNDDDQWLYLPALHKPKRIASDDKTSSFMGSDLSYADMTDRELSLYDFSIMKETQVRGEPCWVIQSMPRSPRVVRDFGYTRSILFVRKDCHVVVRAIHFVKEGKKLKYLDMTRLEQVDGIWTPLEMRVTTKKGKKILHSTVIQYANVLYNQGLSKNFFTARQLEKGI
ncbi:MAG: outer membrane lipoprotein-sorting protein [Desulfobacteraceae bacterium]|nr:outer membrane lipoprotein-sorting protein [Desulfobacteraceae bacterium]